MNSVQTAIHMAVQGGYGRFNVVPDGEIEVEGQTASKGNYKQNLSQIFLDPLFWHALGRALGWKTLIDIQYQNPLSAEAGIDLWLHIKNVPESVYRWHRFIDHLAENKSVDSFFEELLGIQR